MDEMTKHDPDAGFEPAFAAPPNACDAHFHVFGPAEKYPYGSDIRYKPPYEPIERYLKLAHRIGFVRYVFVQPSDLPSRASSASQAETKQPEKKDAIPLFGLC